MPAPPDDAGRPESRGSLGAAIAGDPPVPASASKPSSHRSTSWALRIAALIGLALIVMPAAFQMFDRAPKGATMLADFRPFMTTARLDGFQSEIRQIDAAVREVNGPVAGHFAAAGLQHSGSGTKTPSYSAFASQWPTINSTMTDLLDKVQANLGNYQAVAALPSFKLFPWFFVIPGVITLAGAALALLRPSPRRRRAGSAVLVVVGVGLVLAPVAFQMFSRAPAGGRMMSAFKSIETTGKVEQIQGYFSQMAVGQGAIRLEIVPALQKTELSPAQIAADFPAIAALDQNWIHILNDMTPMIGAMSNNVSSYQAIASLPPFPLFPWFFVIPGVLVAGLGLFTRSRRRPEPSHQPQP